MEEDVRIRKINSSVDFKNKFVATKTVSTFVPIDKSFVALNMKREGPYRIVSNTRIESPPKKAPQQPEEGRLRVLPEVDGANSSFMSSVEEKKFSPQPPKKPLDRANTKQLKLMHNISLKPMENNSQEYKKAPGQGSSGIIVNDKPEESREQIEHQVESPERRKHHLPSSFFGLAAPVDIIEMDRSPISGHGSGMERHGQPKTSSYTPKASPFQQDFHNRREVKQMKHNIIGCLKRKLGPGIRHLNHQFNDTGNIQSDWGDEDIRIPGNNELEMNEQKPNFENEYERKLSQKKSFFRKKQVSVKKEELQKELMEEKP